MVQDFHSSKGITGPALPSTRGGQGRSVLIAIQSGFVAAAFSNNWGNVVTGCWFLESEVTLTIIKPINKCSYLLQQPGHQPQEKECLSPQIDQSWDQ